MKHDWNGQPFALINDPPKLAKPPKQKRAKAVDKAFEKKCKRLMYVAPVATNAETDFRHSNWKTKRALVLATLRAAGQSETSVDAFVQCGAECVVEYNKEEKRYRLRATYCHCRHCEPCQRSKANLLAANLRTRLAVEADGRYRFITLTLRHTDTPLREQLDRLHACFKKLRATKLWKESQKGGCAILEVKYDADRGEWHPHLHIVAEGGYIHQRDLSLAWLDATGDSDIVDIRALNSGKDAAHYVSKYVSKGTNNEVWYNRDAAIEWVLAMKGVRTAATYGRWRGFKLLEHAGDKGTWHRIGLLTHLVAMADEGNDHYIRLIDTIKRDLQYDPHKKRTKTPNT